MEKKTVSLYAFGLVMILVVCAKTVNGADCPSAKASVMPCVGFLAGIAPSPPAQCCSALATLAKEADTKEARQELCNCFKQSVPVSSFGLEPDKVKELLDKCHVQSPIPVDPNVDCNSIPF